MTTLEAAVATETPKRARDRLFLALANAAMAAFVGAWALGPVAAIIGGLAMLALPYLPLLWRVLPGLIWNNRVASVGVLILLCAVAGTIVWGIKFAFGIALVLAPTMLVVVCILAQANSLVDSD